MGGRRSETTPKPVLVSLVTHNDARFVAACLDSVLRQSVPVRLKVFDNASSDETCRIVEQNGVPLEVSPENTGYSRGHNWNLRGEDFETALFLNADVVLKPDYVDKVAAALSGVEKAGMAGGKLFRMSEDGKQLFRDGHPVLDSTGMFFTPAQRHFDRGSGETDQGQYDRRELVFGITGAALACRRAMLEEIGWQGEYLDEDFFAYREDADLAWRGQLSGWKAVYEPRAEALHCRNVLPEGRRRVPPLINYHSLKNRYLMRIKNMDRAVRRRCFPHMWIRDVGILAYVLLLERSSLEAYRDVWRLRRRFREKRRQVQSSRRAGPGEMARWFSFRPVAFEITAEAENH